MKNTEVQITSGSVQLSGNLSQPEGSTALVIFSHGSGSSRFSPRNRYVATVLNRSGISTLLVDLLTIEEDSVYENRFNIPLLTQRLISVTQYFMNEIPNRFSQIGYFGASTGAASALAAAASPGNRIAMVVSRGGRPDLANDALPVVKAPTLLIVGGLDDQVLALNEQAFERMKCKKKLKIIAGATHLFEEPGTLELVAEVACDWFNEHFYPASHQPGKTIDKQ